ncbi:MAG TPA: class I lanthipeptide [Frankiaceae bacterium]|nr:class I lanthipeptide [Frankiaceae bacterium]
MRKLTLKKDTVAELTTDELTAVAGGNNTHKICISGIVACVTFRCPTEDSCLSVVHGAC